MAEFRVDQTDVWYVNLDHRPDRLEHVEGQLARVGLRGRRMRGFRPDEWTGDPARVDVMRRRTPGAIGCHMSQVAIIGTAVGTERNVMVLEDDVCFCADFRERLAEAEEFLAGREWDVLWLGATLHVRPAVWHAATLGRDAERTEHPRFLRTYGIWSTYAYVVNAASAGKILALMTERLHESIGIDWLAIQLQPQLKTFCYVPGMAWQYDNQSDIGNGITEFSGFRRLGPYVWADRREDFDPDGFDWGEAGRR